jgi:predicted phage tail component-like protein
MNGMTYNGIKKDYVVTLRGKRRPPWAPLKRNLLEVPGKAGAYLEGTDIQPRILDIPILINTKSLKDLQTVKEDLAAWLVTDEPKELIFDDEPDRVYYAIVDGTLAIDEIVRVGVGIINFICPDPYKYGPVEKLTPVLTDSDTPIVLHNSGTVDTPPKFDVTLKASTSHLDIIGDDDYMRIGRVVNEDQYAAPTTSLILYDQMGTFSGWVDNTTFDLDSTIYKPRGTMATTGYEFYASDTDTGTGWHGPAKIKSLSKSLTDFEVTLNLKITNTSWSRMGRMELYLLDESLNVAGKLSLRDRTTARDGNHIELRAGDIDEGHYLVQERGDNWNTWLNFDGIIRLGRKGNQWSAYAAMYDSKGNHINRRTREWVDVENKYTRKLKYVLLHIGSYSKNPITPMRVNALKILEHNTLSGEEIPYIGDSGDVFTFDMKQSLILKNGEPFMKKDFGSRFFSLQPGDNAYIVNPAEAIDTVEAEWRARYK